MGGWPSKEGLQVGRALRQDQVGDGKAEALQLSSVVRLSECTLAWAEKIFDTQATLHSWGFYVLGTSEVRGRRTNASATFDCKGELTCLEYITVNASDGNHLARGIFTGDDVVMLGEINDVISGVKVDEETGLCTGTITKIIKGEVISHPLVISSRRLSVPDHDLNPFERAVKMAAQKPDQASVISS